MPWEHILNIRLNKKIVYKREIDDKNSICISDKNKSSLDKDNYNSETLYNIEINDNITTR